MFDVPKHIISALRDGDTSLGKHGAFPPSDETDFIERLVRKRFESVSQGFSTDDRKAVADVLSSLIYKCMRMEEDSRSALSKLAVEYVSDRFKIPQDTVIIDAKITNKISAPKKPMRPEEVSDFSFDSVSEMAELNDEIYKRRFLDAVVSGASNTIGWDIQSYVSEIYRINPKLPQMYSQIEKCNNFLLYLESDKQYFDGMPSGNVETYIMQPPLKPRVVAEGVIFPSLLTEVVSGLLDIAASQGLPDVREKAEYVVKKADFRYAEVWDLRIGIPLWDRIAKIFKDSDIDVDDIGVDYILMSLSEIPTQEFNEGMQEILSGTKKGKSLCAEIASDIATRRKSDMFNRHLMNKNGKHQINDSEGFTPEELRSDTDF